MGLLVNFFSLFSMFLLFSCLINLDILREMLEECMDDDDGNDLIGGLLVRKIGKNDVVEE